MDRAHRLPLALYAKRLAYTREAVYQQTQRWLKAGVFEVMVHDLRALLRLTGGRASEPTTAVFETAAPRCVRYLRAGHVAALSRSQAQERFEGACGRGHFGAPARLVGHSGRRAGPGAGWPVLAEAVQEATGESVQLAYVDQGYSGERADAEAKAHGIRLEVVSSTLRPGEGSCSCREGGL